MKLTGKSLEHHSRLREVWRWVVGFEGIYKVSNRGRVYSVKRITKFNKEVGDKILKLSLCGNKYLFVRLCKNGEVHNKLVHRLVAESFIPIDINRKIVNHLDSDRSNNIVENLEWCTQSENLKHGVNQGNVKLATPKIPIYGLNCISGARLDFESTREAQRKGFTQSSISNCLRGKRGYKSHKGYYWFHSRPQARTKAIERANEILNNR